MSTRTIGFLKVAAVVATAAVGFAPATARAQTNRGQLVQAVVKLNSAQLAFVKKLADDPTFAGQFDQATSSGNYDAAAGLVAMATGLAKSSISVGSAGRPGGHDGASAATTPTTVFHMASFTPRGVERKGATAGKVCFNLGWVQGCVEWA